MWTASSNLRHHHEIKVHCADVLTELNMDALGLDWAMTLAPIEQSSCSFPTHPNLPLTLPSPMWCPPTVLWLFHTGSSSSIRPEYVMVLWLDPIIRSAVKVTWDEPESKGLRALGVNVKHLVPDEVVGASVQVPVKSAFSRSIARLRDLAKISPPSSCDISSLVPCQGFPSV